MVFARLTFVLVVSFLTSWGSEWCTMAEECFTDENIDKSEVPSAMDVYLDWAIKNGAKFPKVFINDTVDNMIRGRTVHAKEAVRYWEEVIFIPEHMMMTYGRARRTRIGNLVSKESVRRGFSTVPGFTEQMTVLASFFLHESKDPMSYWEPYFKTLSKPDHFPLNFVKLCRSELRYTTTMAIIENKYIQAWATYDAYSQFGEYPFYDYLQSYIQVDSRSFTLTKPGIFMAPIAELINHDNPSNVDYMHNERLKEWNGLSMKAKIDIKKGDEITIFYGLSNRNCLLFASFGFLTSDMQSSCARIHVSLMHWYPDYQKKVRMLPRLQDWKLAEDYMIDLPENYQELQVQKVFQILRIFTQPLEIASNGKVMSKLIVEREKVMLKEFLRILEAANNRMKGSLSEDENLLEELKDKDSLADTRLVQLIRVRLEERKVLLVWKTFANECIGILQNKKVIKTSRSSSYLDRVIAPLVHGRQPE